MGCDCSRHGSTQLGATIRLLSETKRSCYRLKTVTGLNDFGLVFVFSCFSSAHQKNILIKLLKLKGLMIWCFSYNTNPIQINDYTLIRSLTSVCFFIGVFLN